MTDTLCHSANVCKGRPFTIAALSGLGDMGPKVAVPLTMPFQNLEAAFAGLGGTWAWWLMAIEACSAAVRSSRFWGKRQGSPIDDEQAVGRHMLTKAAEGPLWAFQGRFLATIFLRN